MSNSNIDPYRQKLKSIKAKLDAVGPGFCMLKWHYQQLYLHLGETHSCFIPSPHPIPTEELAERPEILHNTPWKLKQRDLMMKGERPEECGRCWQAEDSDHLEGSTRLAHLAADWRESDFQEAIFTGGLKPVNPRFLELSFSSQCHLKCAYCGPDFSTSWQQEITEHGPYKISSTQYKVDSSSSEGHRPTPESNQYLKAFWNWWPSLRKDLRTIRLTGGEPLLSEDVYRLIESISETPCPDLEMQVITSLSVDTRSVERLVETLSILLREKKIKSLQIRPSLEAWDEQARYIRYGIDLDLFEANFHLIAKGLPEAKVEFCSTLNSLSIPGYQLFLEKLLQWRRQYGDSDVDSLRFSSALSQAWNPPHFKISVLTEEFKHHFEEIGRYLEAIPIFAREARDWTRIHHQFLSGKQNEETLVSARKDFSRFFDEYDKRRGLNFLETFPEHAEFKSYCDSLID